jgi:hypothetical protein
VRHVECRLGALSLAFVPDSASSDSILPKAIQSIVEIAGEEILGEHSKTIVKR